MANPLKKQIISVIITVLAAWAVWGAYKLFFATKQHEYIVYYTDVKGLQASSPVVLHGVRIGKIKDITIEKAGLVKIVLQVQDDVILHKGARAELKSAGLISNKSISIIDGSDGTTLKDGDIIASDTLTAGNTSAQDTDAIKNKIYSADSALQYIHDSSNIIHTTSAGLSTFEKKMGSYAGTSKSLVNQVNNLAPAISSLSSSSKELSNSSKTLPSKTKNIAYQTEKINQSGIKNKVDTLKHNINTLSKAIQDAKSITDNSKTYNQTTKSIESVNNGAKDNYNHPKGFRLIGKNKKKK